MPKHPPPDPAFDATHRAPVCGIDEVGRGPWAGPLVAAAVVLGPHLPALLGAGLADSKTLPRNARERIARMIRERCICGIGKVPASEIDALGLTRANDLAMERALAALGSRPGSVLVDGRRVPKGINGLAVIGGDRLSPAIAAASVLAKVHRDALMADLARTHPGYGWETNMGYGTPAHRAGLDALGVSPAHRRCFKPIQERLVED